uniref:Uncharacterized protein n=1 Tax=Picea sitchensis TaxID=3332 RepID=D5ABI4_PICSI|nr:unknown [Picea sitchensis]
MEEPRAVISPSLVSTTSHAPREEGEPNGPSRDGNKSHLRILIEEIVCNGE